MLCPNDGSPPLNSVSKWGIRAVARFFPVFPRFPLKLSPFSSLAEDEEDGAAEAERRPDEVEAEFLAHEEHGERHEDGERDDFLHDLELGERERGVADAVRGHLQKIFEEGYPPAHNSGQPPRLARHVLQVSVPGERHKAVRADEEEDRAVDGGDGDDGFDDFLHGGAVLRKPGGVGVMPGGLCFTPENGIRIGGATVGVRCAPPGCFLLVVFRVSRGYFFLSSCSVILRRDSCLSTKS